MAGKLAHKSRQKGGIDTTTYGHYGKGLKLSEHGFEKHHLGMISLAITTAHAAIVANGANALRRRAALRPID